MSYHAMGSYTLVFLLNFLKYKEGSNFIVAHACLLGFK